MQEKKKRGVNWSSLIGWLIFILIFAGGPLLRLLRQAFGGSLTLPANLPNLIPLAVVALVVLSIVISAVRALGGAGRRAGDTRLPTNMPPPRSPSAPMPPFGGASAPRMPPTLPRASALPRSSATSKLPTPPRFEPIINPRLIVFGIAGLVVLGALGLVVLGISLP